MEHDPSGLEAELRQFTGTQRYHRNFTGILYTDGIGYLAEKAGAYWLIDLVGSHQPKLQGVPFQVWSIKVHEDDSALVTMVEDTGEPIKVSQGIPFTDFPLRDFSFYYIHDGHEGVMLLKSEY